MYIILLTVIFIDSKILKSHNEELWGLECSPRNGGFFTAGYDKQLFYFDSEAHKVVWSKVSFNIV